MKKLVSQLLCCAVMALSAAAAERAAADPRLQRIFDPKPSALCEDSMETVPATDDPAPVLIPTADITCKVTQLPIHA